MKIDTVSMPEYWAGFLINNCKDGLTFDDLYRLSAFKLDNPQFGPCLSCGENSYIGRYEGKLCNMLDYTFPVLEVTA